MQGVNVFICGGVGSLNSFNLTRVFVFFYRASSVEILIFICYVVQLLSYALIFSLFLGAVGLF